MYRAAVWQRISNSNIKIVYNSTEHFLWNPSDFSSDDVLSCLWIVFTNSVFQVPPQKIVRRVEILGIGWPGVIGLTRNESVLMGSYACGIPMFCLRNKAPPHFSNRTIQHLRHNFPWNRPISRQTDNPWLSYSQDLNPPDYFLRGYLKYRVCENNPQTREDIIRKEIRWIPQ